MSFTRKHLDIDFELATGSFQGGGNSHSVRGLRAHAEIVKAGGASLGGASITVYGLPLSVMNQLATYGQVLTLTGRNSVTVKAYEDGQSPTVVFMGTIASASVDGAAQPEVGFHVEAYAGGYEQAKPVMPTSLPGSQDVAILMGTIAQKAGLQFEGNGVSGRIQNPYFPGTAVQQIRALADAMRLEHVIDCGTLAVWHPSGSRQGDSAVISKNTGLVSYPMFDSQGVVFRTLWQPTLVYGGKVTLQSEFTPACGMWIAHKLTYNLASLTPNGGWFCDVWAHRVGQMPVA